MGCRHWRHKPQKRYWVRGHEAKRFETNGRHILEGTRNKAQNTGVQRVRDTDAKPGGKAKRRSRWKHPPSPKRNPRRQPHLDK